MGALALAFGLAFGLGDVIWPRSRRAAPKLEQTGRNMERMAGPASPVRNPAAGD